MTVQTQCLTQASAGSFSCLHLEPRHIAVEDSCGEVPARMLTAVARAQCMRGPLFPDSLGCREEPIVRESAGLKGKA
eukprot:11984332-Alexandrium_andersonii.AAC.1